MKKTIIAFISVIFLAYIAGKFMVEKEFTVDPSTERACQYGADITKKGFIGTEFEDFDFYQSCLENIYNANPLRRRYNAK